MAIPLYPKKTKKPKDIFYLAILILIPIVIIGMTFYFLGKKPKESEKKEITLKETLEIKDQERLNNAFFFFNQTSFQNLISPPGYLLEEKEEKKEEKEKGKINPFE